MKKYFTLILLALLPIMANAYDALIDGIYYNFSGNEAIVTYENYQSASYSGSVVIPKTVTYNGKTYRVTSVGDYAFYGCTELTTAIIQFGDSLIYGKNLIVNGDFSSGNEGFTSDYVYINEKGEQVMNPEGTYAVGTSPNDYLDPNFMDHGDHTTGTGNMLIVNGSPSNQDYVWKQNIYVEKGKTYEFSAWLMNIDIYSIGDHSRFSNDFIEYSINRTAILGTYDKTENDWERFYGRYTATESGEVEIKIRTKSEVLKGNDFAIDDICFSAMSVSPDAKTSIGSYAFAKCPKLRQVLCYSKMAPDIQNSTFEDSNIKNAMLLVPAGSVNLYKAVSPWNNFGTIQAIDDNTKYIGTAQDLVAFANLVNAGYNDIDAMLIADIDFTAYPDAMIGSEDIAYQGDFDGAGHAIALDLQRSSDWAGLFCNLSGYVHDLTTYGRITTSAKFAAGIAARTSDATIERCQSRVNIETSVNGDGTHGGIVGVSYGGTIIRDCLVNGSIFGSQTNSCAGVSGWAGGNTNISNCLVRILFSVDTYRSDLLARNSSNVTSSNNYYQGNWNAPNDCGNVTILTEKQVESGEACFLLNDGRIGDEMVWYQSLGEDESPVPDNRHLPVWFIEGSYVNPDFDYYFTITVDNTGYGTYCSKYPLDFSRVSGLNAYIASGFSPSTGKLVLTRVEKVPAGEGLLLVGEAGTYEVPFKETDMFYSNLLKGVTTDTTLSQTDGSYSNFILSDGYYGIGFYNLFSAYELEAGKAYLQLPTSSVSRVKAISFVFEDDEDAVQSIDEDSRTQRVYNIGGQIICKPQKGINIIRYSDGTSRKVLVK